LARIIVAQQNVRLYRFHALNFRETSYFSEVRHHLFREHVHTAPHLALVEAGFAEVAADRVDMPSAWIP
jgi:hypothetical protein